MRNNQGQERSRILLHASAIVVFAFALAALPGQSPAEAQPRHVPAVAPIVVQPGSLLIMDKAVIADPNRINDPCQPAAGPLQPWSFGALMKGIAGTKDDSVAREFITDWLRKFTTVQPVNGEDVVARDISGVLSTWEAAGWDLRSAPFQLLAIINRIDLLRSPLLAGENAGEVRFVFGAVATPKYGKCGPVNFTVILEYGVRKSSCDGLQGWAKKWLKLGGQSPGSDAYNKILWPLTDSVTTPKLPQKPNGSPIDHVRTNESVNSSKWQLREFRLDPKTGKLMQDTVTLTPKDSLDGSTELTAYLTSIDSGIEATPQDYWIPQRFPAPSNTQLLGAMAVGGKPSPWSSHQPGFALNTCSGCHGGQMTLPSHPVHIDPMGGPISGFLQSDLVRRGKMLGAIATDGCSATLSDDTRMVH
jgi:hypothetical protein